MKNCNHQKATDNVPSLEKGSMNMCEARVWLSQSSFWLYRCDTVTVFIAPLLHDDLPWERNSILTLLL